MKTQQKMKFKQKRIAALVSLALAMGAGTADAALQRMGPINNAPTVGGFPSWFQDTTGLTMEFCDLINQAELNGGWCTLIPPTPATAPETFPTNFFIEHFYWDAKNVSKAGAATKVSFTMAVEGSFTNGAVVIPGQQVTFGRLRIFIPSLPFSGTYTVYHPYGVWVFPGMTAGQKLFFTEDVGLGCPGTFDCTLGTSIGPFLLPSATSGGAEVPPIPGLVAGQDPFYDAIVAVGGASVYPGTGKTYIADPKRIGPVTGSPLPPFLGNDGVLHNHNTLRVEGPNGFVYDAPNNFSLTGRFVSAAIPGATNVERASYGVSAAGNKLDVFATASASTAARLPGQPVPPTVTPALGFYEAPCAGAIDPLTGAVLPPPYTAPVGFVKKAMTASGANIWGQSQPAVIPGYACVEDDTARDALGNIIPAFYLKKVTDDVTISVASYNGPGGGNLTVSATSTDPASILTLTGFGVGGTGLDLVAGSATVPALTAPPAYVQVTSTNGGVAGLQVSTALGTAAIAGVPVVPNSTVTMFEDCTATVGATSCATPQVINALAGATLNGAALPAGAVVTITQAPRLGTAVVNLDGTISYTPNPNANGSDAIGYTVTSGTTTSTPALISITITPVNDFPVANNDLGGALRGVANSFNVFANDTSPDGAAVLTGGTAHAVIVTGNPALGITAGASFPLGNVTYTPPATTAAGLYNFTYNAVDANGMVSQIPATVTVSVAAAEAILPQKAIYTQTKGLWTLQGTISPAAGQTITGTYVNGTYKVAGACTGNAAGTTIGSAVADGTGLWLYAQALASTTGVQNPSNTLGNSTGFWCTPPSSMKFTSSLTGASVTFPISLK